MAYGIKLRDPRWQKKRLQVLDRAQWRCEACGDTESTLHVHHKPYFKGRDPWEYDNDQLAVLCESCHEFTHETPDVLLDVISRLPLDGPGSRREAALLIAGYCGIALEHQHKSDSKFVEIGEMARRSIEVGGGGQ